MKDFFAKPFTIDRIARIIFIILAIFLAGYIVRSLMPILLPFGLAWLVAYMLMPLVRFFQNKLRFKSRILSILTVLFLMISIITSIVLLLLPSIKEEVSKGWELISFYASSDVLLKILPESIRERLEEYTDLESVVAGIDMDRIVETVREFVTKSWSLVMSTFSFLMGLFVIFLFFLYLIFIMNDYEGLNKGIYHLLPKKIHPFVSEAIDNVEYYVNSYFKGQSLIALCVGVLLAIGFRIIDLPMGISIGLLIGVFNLIPYMQTLGLIPITLASLLKAADADQNFFVVLALALGILGVVQVIQDTILVPKILGKTMGMKPAVILLSLSIWGSLLGILGMLFALPLTMILYTYHMKYIVGEPIEKGGLVEPVKESKLSKWFGSKSDKDPKPEE
ncbi:AI-2E family transporter [Porphyromonas sp.]|uniref:AI-2E family transporter n=1 Tax=Porphyromonas sp. TaxID=1924944 RepID=UPI0026DC7A90|nr:AI-2E family transporter [Porphyromonas sp.]MDO4771779.1 AI-2E family transporter [Porphyromonas sp.]